MLTACQSLPILFTQWFGRSVASSPVLPRFAREKGYKDHARPSIHSLFILNLTTPYPITCISPTMVSPKYLLAATAYFSLASSTALSKLTSEQKANPLGLKLGSKSGSVTPPLPDTYHNSVVNYTTPLTSRSLNSRAEKYVGTKDQNCDEYQCYTWWDVYVCGIISHPS